MSRLRTVAATDTGYLRSTNQDVALATNDLAAVADGMGGTSAARLPPASRSSSCSRPTVGTGRQMACSQPSAPRTSRCTAAASPTATFAVWARP